MRGDRDVVSGFHNKLSVAASGVVPPDRLAEQNRNMAEPGSGEE